MKTIFLIKKNSLHQLPETLRTFTTNEILKIGTTNLHFLKKATRVATIPDVELLGLKHRCLFAISPLKLIIHLITCDLGWLRLFRLYRLKINYFL